VIKNRLEAYMQIGDYTHAMEDLNYLYNEGNSWFDSSGHLYYIRGLVYWYTGDKKKAKEDFNQAVEKGCSCMKWTNKSTKTR